MSNIRIFVSHRIDIDSETVDTPVYFPVRCGAVYDESNSEIQGDAVDFFGIIKVRFRAMTRATIFQSSVCRFVSLPFSIGHGRTLMPIITDSAITVVIFPFPISTIIIQPSIWCVS